MRSRGSRRASLDRARGCPEVGRRARPTTALPRALAGEAVRARPRHHRTRRRVDPTDRRTISRPQLVRCGAAAPSSRPRAPRGCPAPRGASYRSPAHQTAATRRHAMGQTAHESPRAPARARRGRGRRPCGTWSHVAEWSRRPSPEGCATAATTLASSAPKRLAAPARPAGASRSTEKSGSCIANGQEHDADVRAAERKRPSRDVRSAGVSRSSLSHESHILDEVGSGRCVVCSSPEEGRRSCVRGRLVRHRRGPQAVAAAAIDFASRRSPVRGRLAPSPETRHNH
jgi:hypothetical protein